MKYFYIYKIIHKETGEFYIGKRTTNITPHEDDYYGSGVWVTNYVKKTAKLKRVPKSAFKCQVDHIFQKEILEICNSIEDINEKEVLYIKNSKNDTLCRNKSNGGDGFGSGSLNINYDENVYEFYDLYEDIKFKSTQREMVELYNIPSSMVSCLVNNKIQRYKNYILYENYDNVILKYQLNSKIYEFYDVNNGIKLTATRKEMIQNYGANKSIIYLIKGEVEYACGYVLWSNRDKYCQRSRKYEFYDINKGIKIIATLSDMVKVYKCRSHIHDLIRGKHKQINGYCLWENRDFYRKEN